MKSFLISLIFCVPVLCFAQNNEDLQLIQSHIDNQVAVWNLIPTDVEDLILTDYHQSSVSGTHHFYFRQAIEGIELFNSNANAHIHDNRLVQFKHNFKSRIFEKYNTLNPAIDSKTAIRQAASHLGQEQSFDLRVKEEKNSANREIIYLGDDYAYDDIFAKLSFYPLKKDLILCWEVAINDKITNKWWQVFVNASDGQIIDKISWTVECRFDEIGHNIKKFNIKEDEAPKHQRTVHCNHDHASSVHEKSTSSSAAVVNNSYNVFAIPIMTPLDGERSIAVSPWNDAPNASPYGWHDTNGAAGAEYTITRGNNVHAQEDRNGNNGTGTSPDGGANLEFDFDFDEDDTPVNYTDFATVNLFYWNNVAHDVWYQYGFDEASGNFQANNYGNGGADDDYVRADAQDGSGTNNANFSSPPDGSKPRMQMFEWSAESFNTFKVNSPSSIARFYGAAGASFGPQDATATGDLVIADPILGCSSFNNSGAIDGNIALIDRGNCNFTTKVKNAQNAGAIAAIICNNTDQPPTNMGGSDGTITIPSIMISKLNCDTIKQYLPGVVNVTFNLNSPVTKDSDLENGVILHEYGHGISIRLTGGANTSSCLQGSEQMGEGWSDYIGLVTTMQPGDVGPGGRGMGSYLKGEPLNDEGIRTYPYTTDMSVNQHTYDDIKTATVPHGVGSVWCEMLWEVTWALIDEHGFDPDIYNGTGGNNIAMALVIEGMKLQPCNPGFVDGRDAILLADMNMNGGANQCIIWEAFAKRGLGFSASQGSSSSRSDGTEAFDIPSSCDIGLKFDLTAHQFSESGTNLNYGITATNDDTIDMTMVVVSDTLPTNVSLVSGTLSCGTETGGIITIDHGNLNIGSSLACEFDVNTDLVPNSPMVFFDGIEGGTANWTVSSDQGSAVFVTSSANPQYGTTSWFIPNVPADNSQFLTSTTIDLGSNPVLAFGHDYDTELGWDGGMVEISTNGGSSWTDLGEKMFFNGYNSSLGTSSNPDIAGRSAFTGDSNGYLTTYADLSDYANQSVQIRFFFGSDDNTIETGWYIDHVIMYDASYIINTACITSAEGHLVCDTTTTLVRLECAIPNIYYEDADGDGFGNVAVTLSSCSPFPGYVSDFSDCDDTDPENYPGNTEVCDGKDNDCDGVVDEDCMAFTCDGDSLYISTVTQDIYRAQDYIESDAVIDDNEDIEYYAGIDIKLIGEFEVLLGAEFYADIQSCSILMRINNDDSNNNEILDESENWISLLEKLRKTSTIELYDDQNNLIDAFSVNTDSMDSSALKAQFSHLKSGEYYIGLPGSNNAKAFKFIVL